MSGSELSKVASAAATAVKQWENLPKLLEAGHLVKQSGGWYRVIDHAAAMDEIGHLVQEVEFRGPGGKVSRVKLGKPDPKLAEELAALARQQQ